MMHNHWQVAKRNCHKNPLPHIYCKNFVKLDAYDHLYEQWNNIEHEKWKKFIDQNHVELYFHDDLIKALIPKRTSGYIGYWFFRQRTDKSVDGNIILDNSKEKKLLEYYQNTIMILDVKNTFSIMSRKNLLPSRPFCEIYFNKDTDEQIKKLLL